MPFGVIYKAIHPQHYLEEKELRKEYKLCIWKQYQEDDVTFNVSFRTQHLLDMYLKEIREKGLVISKIYYMKPSKLYTNDKLFSTYHIL
jgi:hypothetical protein